MSIIQTVGSWGHVSQTVFTLLLEAELLTSLTITTAMSAVALVVQALMGILVLGTLLWKRQREKPRRPWKIW